MLKRPFFFLINTSLIVATIWSEKEEDLLSYRLVPDLPSLVVGVSNSTVSLSQLIPTRDVSVEDSLQLSTEQQEDWVVSCERRFRANVLQ